VSLRLLKLNLHFSSVRGAQTDATWGAPGTVHMYARTATLNTETEGQGRGRLVSEAHVPVSVPDSEVYKCQ
jgi:hypothetical protein